MQATTLGFNWENVKIIAEFILLDPQILVPESKRDEENFIWYFQIHTNNKYFNKNNIKRLNLSLLQLRQLGEQKI